MIFQMVPRDPLRLHPLARLGVEEQRVQLFDPRPCLHELGRDDVGAGRGGGELEAAGVGGNAGVQAVGNVRGDVHPHFQNDPVHQLCGRSGMAVQQGIFRVAAVARVVVDAEIHMAGELRHPVVFAKELDACHVHRHDDLRLEFALVQAGVGKRIPSGDGVGAEHRRCFIQRTERIVQGTAAADGITVRVFVAQNQNVVRSKELFSHLLHIQLFCHPMIHPFRKAVIPRSPTALRRRSHSARGAAH